MTLKPEFLTACRFYLGLQLDGFSHVDAYFESCQGFTRTQDVIEACEVTRNKWANASKGQVVRTKLPGNVRSGNVTLRRGMTFSNTLWNWFDAVQNGKWKNQRRNLFLSLYNQAGIVQVIYVLTEAWPVGYIISDVNARSAEMEIEELEVAFEGFERLPVMSNHVSNEV
jgi:phage tail-like protein